MRRSQVRYSFNHGQSLEAGVPNFEGIQESALESRKGIRKRATAHCRTGM